MSVHDAEPNDVYVDGSGKLWRVVWTCHEPTVGVEAVEPSGYLPGPDGAIDAATGSSLTGSFIREKRSGGVSGQMWQNFRRVWRRDDPCA